MRYVDAAASADRATPPHAKLAALALHALSGADCRWVLQRLDPQQRRAIEPLLNELGQLGMPKDASGAWSGSNAPAPRDPEPLAPVQATGIDAVPGLNALLALAEVEPPRLIGLALRPHAAALQQDALARLDALRRREVRAALDLLAHNGGAPRKLAQCLAAEMALLPQSTVAPAHIPPSRSASAAPSQANSDDSGMAHRAWRFVDRMAALLPRLGRNGRGWR